ncbi:MAG TPA: hypothetical protein VNI77_08915 [Nitrososphaera sp.]|nr:hypothetical protein [Nitrososphaera sp.]
MQKKTWLHRLTDGSNLWFNAVKAEDEGDYEGAISYYIKDALECIKQHSLVRAALSCSCAANCLERIGAPSLARVLYSEAGSIYVENSELSLSESIREALWSLQEAFENYVLAGDSAAEIVRDRYVILAARTSPFSKIGNVVKDLEPHRAEPVTLGPIKETRIAQHILAQIEAFVKARKISKTCAVKSDPNHVMKAIDRSGRGGSRLDEKGIVS